MSIDDELKTVKGANKDVRKAVREGNLDLGMNAEEKVQTALMHMMKYEKGLLGQLDEEMEKFDDAYEEFKDARHLNEDEEHKWSESENKWARINTYLLFLESKIEEIEHQTAEDEEVNINVDSLLQGKEDFAAEQLNLTGYDGALYGLLDAEKELNEIVENSLKPIAGELQNEDNEVHDAIKKMTEALGELTEMHNELLEVKEILRTAEEEDNELKELLKENGAHEKAKNEIKDFEDELGEVESAYEKLEEYENRLFEEIERTHELLKSHIQADQELLNRIKNDIGEIKWFNMKSTGFIRRLRSVTGASDELDNELNRIINELDASRDIIHKVLERKEGEMTDEEEILENIEQYMSKFEG